jgi:hypothetical protein
MKRPYTNLRGASVEERQRHHEEYCREYYQRNKEKMISRGKERRIRIRKQVLEHYGGVCACCKEGRYEFLAIDHVNGGGNAMRKAKIHEKGFPFYIWIIKNNYPDGFRVLCHNCNMSIGLYGYCPHQEGGV